MRKIEVKIRQFFWALKKSFKPTTDDFVIYQGIKCQVLVINKLL